MHAYLKTSRRPLRHDNRHHCLKVCGGRQGLHGICHDVGGGGKGGGGAAAGTAALVTPVAVFHVPHPDPSYWCWAAGSYTGRAGGGGGA